MLRSDGTYPISAFAQANSRLIESEHGIINLIRRKLLKINEFLFEVVNFLSVVVAKFF